MDKGEIVAMLILLPAILYGWSFTIKQIVKTWRDK